MPSKTQHLAIRAGLLLLLAALLAVPGFIRKKNAHTGDAQTGRRPSLERYGFYLEETARQSGIDFIHEAPVLDAKLDPIMPQIASMGAAVSVTDFDRDGWQDLYITSSRTGSRNRLYRNQGDGTFQDVAPALGVADVNREGTGVSTGAVWGDYDNDGYEDLFLYKWGRPELFHNDRGENFTRITQTADLPGWVNAGSAVWFDYDRDGLLDLFLAGYWSETLDLWHLSTTRIMPESFEYANNGGRKYLLRNRGNGAFEDITDRAGIHSRRWTLAVAAADLDDNGHPDLFLANDYGLSELYLNDGNGIFREVGRSSGVGRTPKSGMNAAFGDILNKGDLAIYETNISEAGVLIQGNNLWVPRRSADGNLEYDNLAASMDVEMGGWSFGAQFGDLNNDGNVDLYLVNGYVSAEKGADYWYDFSQIAGGHSRIIVDAANWPPMNGRSLSGHQQKRVWINDGAGRFLDVAQTAGVHDRYDGRAVALADLWNRGALDVIVANQKGPLLIYKNYVLPERAWIAFELRGRASNRSAIGARVRLFWNGRQQLQEVSGGSGYSAQNQRRLHFGLGNAPRVEKAVITWPSGKTQTLETPEINRLHKIEEPLQTHIPPDEEAE